MVECYQPGLTGAEVEDASVGLRRTGGPSARCVGSIFVPADEAAFHFFSARSAEDVAELCSRAELDFERIVGTVAISLFMPLFDMTAAV